MGISSGTSTAYGVALRPMPTNLNRVSLHFPLHQHHFALNRDFHSAFLCWRVWCFVCCCFCLFFFLYITRRKQLCRFKLVLKFVPHAIPTKDYNRYRFVKRYRRRQLLSSAFPTRLHADNLFSRFKMSLTEALTPFYLWISYSRDKEFNRGLHACRGIQFNRLFVSRGQVYKWVPPTYCWRVALPWTSIPSRGE